MEWTKKKLITSSLILAALLVLGSFSTPALDLINDSNTDDAGLSQGTVESDVETEEDTKSVPSSSDLDSDGSTAETTDGSKSKSTTSGESDKFCIEIHKIEELDNMDAVGSAEWYYELKVSDDGGSTWEVRESSKPLDDSKDTMIVDNEHFFDVTNDKILFRMTLKDEDSALDDTADISERPDKGWFDDDGKVFKGVYWMENHTVGGDRTEENEIHWLKTSGEWDDSGDDEDTNLLFNVYEKGRPDIKRPIFTVPKIQEKGKNIEVTVTSSEEPNTWNVELFTPSRYPTDLDIEDITKLKDDRWRLECEIPGSMESRLYDLVVSNEFGSDSEYHAVQIVDEIDDEFNFIHMSDLHVGYDEDFYSIPNVKQAIREANLINPDFVFITGDVCDKVMGWYKDQHPDPIDQDRRTLQLLQMFDVPIYVGSGNHDWSYDGYNDERQNIESYKRWINPYLNFSFNYGDHHFSYMDTKSYVGWLNPDSPMGMEGIDWLKNDLEQNIDKTQRFVGYHHPVYPDNFDDESVRSELAQTLIDYNVSMALTGHTHIESIHDAYGNEQTGEMGNPAQPIHATVSDIEGGNNYRLVRVQGNDIADYTYDEDGDGERPANSSIPTGELSVEYTPSNSGDNSKVVATIENGLYEYFEDASISFKVPDDGSDYTVENGTVRNMKDIGAYLRFNVLTDVPEDNTKKVTIRPSNYLEADFTWSPDDPTVQDTVQFDHSGNKNDISSFSWDFGDGSTSTETSPSHGYSSPGTYTVELTVEDADGKTDTSTKQITVSPEDENVNKLNEDFEGDVDWSTSGLWHLTTENDQYGDANSGSNAMWYGQDSTGDYDTGSHTTGSLVSPTLDLSEASEAELTFQHWFETENCDDGHWDKVIVRVNDQQVYYRDTTDDNMGSEDNFVRETIDISEYTGQTIEIQFVFDSVDDYDNAYRGWYVDDVKVTADSGGDEDDDGDEDDEDSGSVVISEVYYDVEGTDSDGEYIEIYNQGSEAVDLSGWTIGDDTSANYTFEDSLAIPGHSYLTVCRDKATFEDRYNKSPDAWDLALSLNNGGDTLTLYDTNGQTVDKVGWEQNGWSNLSASTGEVIRREDTSEDTDTVEDWVVSQPDPQVLSDGESSTGKLLSEDFEGEHDWSTSGLWHSVTENDQYGDSHSGSHSMWYGQDSKGNYDTGSRTNGILSSPTVDLSSVSDATLRFRHWFRTESHEDSYDHCEVKVNGEQVYFRDTSDENVGSEDNFVKETIDISSYAGQTVQIEFVFDSVDDYDNGYRGWYIDDVAVTTG